MRVAGDYSADQTRNLEVGNRRCRTYLLIVFGFIWVSMREVPDFRGFLEPKGCSSLLPNSAGRRGVGDAVAPPGVALGGACLGRSKVWYQLWMSALPAGVPLRRVLLGGEVSAHASSHIAFLWGFCPVWEESALILHAGQNGGH